MWAAKWVFSKVDEMVARMAFHSAALKDNQSADWWASARVGSWDNHWAVGMADWRVVLKAVSLAAQRDDQKAGNWVKRKVCEWAASKVFQWVG